MNRYEFLDTIINHKSLLFQNYSFSQEGEDMILDELLRNTKKGFYVDIGAHHPFRFSNTQRLYMHGWCGINVDATPGSMRLFSKYRRRDINVEAGVGETNSEMTYYMFTEGALNSFDKKTADVAIKNGNRLVGEIKVKVYDINTLLEEYLPDNQHIDVLDIDIEGMDSVIIRTINWERYAPDIILIEKENDERGKAQTNNEIITSKGYEMVASSFRTAIYRKKSN